MFLWRRAEAEWIGWEAWAKKLSGFMLFSKEMRPNIIAADPNLSFGDVSKCLGELWRGLPDAEKARYNRTCVPA